MWRRAPRPSAEQATPLWNEHSSPLPLTLNLILTLILILILDFDFDLDLARTRIRRGCPILRVLCEKWEPRTPPPPPLTLLLPLLLQVWNGHSCSLPLTLILILTFPSSELMSFRSAPKAREEPAVSRQHHRPCGDGRLARQRSKATPAQNEHSRRLTLKLILN